MRIIVLSEALLTVQSFDQIWCNSIRKSSEIKREYVFCYFAIVENDWVMKNVEIFVLADLKEFLIRRSMISREVWSIRLSDWCSEARKSRSYQAWTMTSRETDEVVNVLDNVLIVSVAEAEDRKMMSIKWDWCCHKTAGVIGSYDALSDSV